MSEFDHRTRSERRKYRQQLEQRYRRQRQRNCLARPGCHRVVLILDRLKAGYNVAKIFRSAEAFGVAEIHLIDIGPFDPAPAKGAFKQVPARFHPDFDPVYADLRPRGYQFFCLDPDAEAPLGSFQLPQRSAFVLGHEERGLSFDPRGYAGLHAVRIRQFGRVDSLNVSIAASLATYEYTRQWAEPE